MAVHVPLSMEAQAEARFLMLCANNILKPQDGKPVISPSQDMVIGCYYLSCIRPGAKGEGRCFANEDEAMMAYLCGQIGLQSRINVRIARKWRRVWIYPSPRRNIWRSITSPAATATTCITSASTPAWAV